MAWIQSVFLMRSSVWRRKVERYCQLDGGSKGWHIYSVKNNSERNSRRPAFWDRREELAALNAWHAGASRLAVIHGRRRLGRNKGQVPRSIIDMLTG